MGMSWEVLAMLLSCLKLPSIGVGRLLVRRADFQWRVKAPAVDKGVYRRPSFSRRVRNQRTKDVQ